MDKLDHSQSPQRNVVLSIKANVDKVGNLCPKVLTDSERNTWGAAECLSVRDSSYPGRSWNPRREAPPLAVRLCRLAPERELPSSLWASHSLQRSKGRSGRGGRGCSWGALPPTDSGPRLGHKARILVLQLCQPWSGEQGWAVKTLL